jgi:hypothetical protein
MPRLKRVLQPLLRLGLLLGALGPAAGCHRHPATGDDCRAVLDRLIDLELAESGYRDAALAARWKTELAGRFGGDLGRCVGMGVRDDLRACLAAARTPEVIAHDCAD